MNSELWVTEQTKDYMKTSFRVERTLFSDRSPFQGIDIVECPFYGKMLLNDGLVMVSERDEFVYHDMIVHVPLFVHPDPRSVLIIGGGDGGTAREVLRHRCVESCTMVEIDGMVIEACRRHIPQTASVLDGRDERLELIVGDGVAFVKETKKKFDVVLVDSTDPIGPATPLFGPEFYADVFSVLGDEGIVVSQGETPWHEVDVQRSLMGILCGLFPVSLIYTFNNLTYSDGLWCFTFASKGPHPLRDFQEKRIAESGLDFDYYNADVHRASFALPNFMGKNLGSFLKG